MAMPLAIDGQMDEAVVGHDALWRRVLSPESDGGIEITDAEARLVRLNFYRSVVPTALRASDAMSVIRSITSSEGGVCGDRTVRKIKSRWKLRGLCTRQSADVS